MSNVVDALTELEAFVQELRENGETDLRVILYEISDIRQREVERHRRACAVPDNELAPHDRAVRI